MTRPTYIEIDLNAVRHNLARVKALAPGSSVMAMVKANGYGHGAISVAKALEQATALGVASIDEAIQLREAGFTQPMVLMEGVFSANELDEAARHRFTLIIHHMPQVAMLEQVKVACPFSVWLKVNTGMHRLGIAPDDFAQAYKRLVAAASVQKPIGLMTHFAESEMTEGAETRQQIDLFNRLVVNLTGPRSLANSAGILAWPEAHGDWVRPGLMLYGASPILGKTGGDHGLKPVMTLYSKLIAVSHIKKGAKVGYRGTWTAPEDMLLGVVAAGYGDGYPQFTKSGMPILVNGVECALVGRVSMDMLTVDLRHCPEAKIGDKAILWGKGLPVEVLAQHANTSAHEIFTRITSRPKLVLVGE